MIVLKSQVNKGFISMSVIKDMNEFFIAHEGKFVEIVLKKARSKRSDPQNRYYWGGVIPIVRQGLKDLGYMMTKEETHDFLRDKFLSGEMVTREGELIGKQRKSTTALTKSEFGEYISQIQQFGAEILNINIPDPNTQVELTIN